MEWPVHSTHTLEPAHIHVHERSLLRRDLTLSASWNPFEELVTNWQYLDELRHFCDCVLECREPAVGGTDGQAVVEIVHAANVSAWEKRRVQLLDRAPDFAGHFEELGWDAKWHLADAGA